MHGVLSFFYGLLVATAVSCAPMPSLDANVFLQNGKDAQILNAEFAKLNASESCNAGEMACIGASVAHCMNGTWNEDLCPKSLFCFALPSVREEGTVLSCTSNATALAVINASGVTGGIASNSTDESVDFPMDCDDNDEEDEGDAGSTATSATQSATAAGTHASSVKTTSASASITATRTAASSSAAASASDTDVATGPVVTTTVTVAPTSFSTEFAETTTLDASQASSFLSSIATDTNFSILTTIPGPAPTASASASTSASSEAPQSSVFSSKAVGIASAPAVASFTSDVGAPTTITLLSSPSSATIRAAAPAASSGMAMDAGSGYSY
ncbi:hypothetical protein BV20DRAFT_1043331 [Pilatotrama ljubarskyi]|nr:hypothetical protein BV20DRAFT_1043331 [Pilatotrama ljubarskyi]